MSASKAVVSRVGKTSKRGYRSPPALNFMERLPSEVLMRILSYLDPASLFTISHCNKLFYQLSRDNALWRKIYICGLKKNKRQAPKHMEEMLKMELQPAAVGLWRRLYFSYLLDNDFKQEKLLKVLTSISCNTGLPVQRKQILRNLGLTWELTVTDKSGHEVTLEPSWSQVCGISLTLCWSGGSSLHHYQQISTLQLHAIRRIDLGCPSLMTPGWRSLVMKLDMQPQSQGTQVIGQDRLVELKLLQPGIIVGVWRDQCSVAFIMFTLHSHELAKKIICGSSNCSCLNVEPIFDDIDPEHGLHSYQLHIVLHNTVSELVCGRFSQLFCHREHISDGLVRLTAVSRKKGWQHMSLSGSVTLPWRCEGLQGTVENCCIMTLTLLHEFGKLVKCVSSPVSMEPEKTAVFYDYEGDPYLIQYQDSDIQVKMQLVGGREKGHPVLVGLDVYLSVCLVNKHFGRNY